MVFRAYGMAASALPSFPNGKELDQGSSSMITACASECSMAKQRGKTCNAFTIDGGSCYFGFIEPSVLVDNAAAADSASDGAVVYADFADPIE